MEVSRGPSRHNLSVDSSKGDQKVADIIQAEDLTKVYRGKVKAVDRISFRVAEGEIFGFSCG